jgi:hypothetical protein
MSAPLSILGAIKEWLLNAPGVKPSDFSTWGNLIPQLVQRGGSLASWLARVVPAAIAANPIAVGALLFSLVAASGFYVYSELNPSVAQLGPASLKPKPPGRDVVAGGNDPLRKYHIYVLNISGGSVWIGQEMTRLTTPTCSFAGGGLCSGKNDPVPDVIKKSKEYDTMDAAVTDFCKEVRASGGSRALPLTGGRKARVLGGDYWVDTAPGC